MYLIAVSPQRHYPMSLKPELLAAVHGLIAQARERAVSAVDAEWVLIYWHIGQLIVEEEQQGADRAHTARHSSKGWGRSNCNLAADFRGGSSIGTCSYTAPFRL